MAINKVLYEAIINDIEIGNSVAEQDSLLESARVETPVFDSVLGDKYDIIPGRKGAGKTAMFRIFSLLSGVLLKTRNLVILTGVNAHGEPIFNRFKAEFNNFTETDFENFWKLYFIYLVYNEFIKNPKYEVKLFYCEKEIEAFKKNCIEAGIPEIPAVQTKDSIIPWVIKSIKKLSAKTTIIYDAEKPSLFTMIPEVTVEKGDSNQEKSNSTRQSIYINKIGDSLKEILNKSGFKIWIILDRLDEVFDRYTMTEFCGLRGLLRSYKSFEAGQQEDLFRIKLFLRDDIKLFLTDAETYRKFFPKKEIQPLTAATHIFARESLTLSWSNEEIQQLILNRLLLSNALRHYLGIEDSSIEKVKELLRVKQNRNEYWNQIFPEKIQSSSSLTWICSHLKDSNNIVTPRTVIDMLEAAVNYQKSKNMLNFTDCPEIFSTESLKAGLEIASKYKLEKDIYNEFPKEQANIKILEKEGKHKFTKEELKKVYGENWQETVESLQRIGLLSYIKDSGAYRVVSLFRPALGITYKY